MDSTLYLTSTVKKNALVLDFSEIVNYQAAVATAETIEQLADGIIKFAHNLSSGLFTYWHSYGQLFRRPFETTYTSSLRLWTILSIYRSNGWIARQIFKAQMK